MKDSGWRFGNGKRGVNSKIFLQINGDSKKKKNVKKIRKLADNQVPIIGEQ